MTPTPQQHRRMHVLWRLAGVTDRADRLALTAALARRELASSNDLSAGEAQQLIHYMTGLERAGRLEATAQRWLEQLPARPVTSLRDRERPTDRDLELLRMTAEGAADDQIGRALSMTRSGVSSAFARLYRKLGAHSRAQAVHLGYERGWLMVGMCECRGRLASPERATG